MNDQDIQQFMQIRDEIHEEIKKIGPFIIALQDATKGLLSQVDVFKTLSQTAQEHMRKTINDASHDMAYTVSDVLYSKLEGKVQEILTPLDESAQYARRTLDVSKKSKTRKLILLCSIGGLFCSFIGASFGYFYARSHNYALPSNFIKMYALGYEYKTLLSKKNLQEKQKGEKRKGKKL